MNEEPKSKPSHTGVLVFVLLLPILYVLSIGPAIMIFNLGRTPSWIKTFYRPLDWIYDHQPIAREPLEAYMRLWRR